VVAVEQITVQVVVLVVCVARLLQLVAVEV
jgi:hypothetical protein